MPGFHQHTKDDAPSKEERVRLSTEGDKIKHFDNRSGMCRWEASHLLPYFQIARMLVKSAMLQESWPQYLCELFLVTIVGQLVKTPSPPMVSVSAHHCIRFESRQLQKHGEKGGG